MTRNKRITYAMFDTKRLKIAYFMMAACLVLATVYAFNVYRLVSHTVALQKLQATSSSLENNVQKLDSEYLTLSSKITPDTIKQHGFKEGEVTAYISRTPLTAKGADTTFSRVAVGGHEL